MLAFLFACFFLFSAIPAYSIDQTPIHRSDLTLPLHATLCKAAEAPSPKDTWQQGVYEAQAEISWISADHEISEKDIRQLAFQQATEYRHMGYTYGFCNDRHVWLLTTHASGPALKIHQNKLQLSNPILRKACDSVQIDLAPAEKNSPEKIAVFSPHRSELFELDLAAIQQGTLGITCIPSDTLRKGPELWYLLPVGEPSQAISSREIKNMNDLISWIQSRRIGSGLPQLRLQNPVLDRLANEQNPSLSLSHPRTWLLKKKHELASHGISLLGENRVRGTQFHEMAWLLWNSPQHRRLLLHPDAHWLSYRIEKSENDQLLILFFARDMALAQSKTTPRRSY